VIGEPLAIGTFQVIVASLPDTAVVGGSGLSGVKPANKVIGSDETLYPYEFLAFTVKL